MKYTIKKIREAFSLRKFKRALQNPKSVITWIRAVRATARKERMDLEKERRETAERLAKVTGVAEEDLHQYQEELNNLEYADEYERLKQEVIDADAKKSGTSDFDCETIYIAVRAIKPDIVFETGAAHGHMDRHVLAAMEKNGKGQMHALDLPGDHFGFPYGFVIPEDLKHRWTLHEGDANEILPDLLDDLNGLDIFSHDSEHTRKHMQFEYETAYPRIKKTDT